MKRYDSELGEATDGDPIATMVEHPEGDYVEWEDVKHLVEIAPLIQRVNVLIEKLEERQRMEHEAFEVQLEQMRRLGSGGPHP